MTIRIELAQTKQQLEAWNDFVLECPSASYMSSTDWLNAYTSFGVQVRCIVAAGEEGEVVGGAPLVIFRVGPWRWIQIPHGPCLLPGRNDVILPLLDAIDDLAKDAGAMFVQASPFEPSKDHSRWEERAKRCGLAYDPNLLDASDCGISRALAAGFFPKVYSDLINVSAEGIVYGWERKRGSAELLASTVSGVRPCAYPVQMALA